MGKKRIKHLGKRKRRYKSLSYFIKKICVIVATVLTIITFIYLNKHTKELYKGIDIKESAIEFYIDVADEIGNKEVQLNWKELMAIDMVRYNDDLSNVIKKEIIDIGEKFIKIDINEQNDKVKKVKNFNKVIDEIGFNNEQKN